MYCPRNSVCAILNHTGIHITISLQPHAETGQDSMSKEYYDLPTAVDESKTKYYPYFIL